MEAVTGGLEGSPLVLIQGPPGTGKTKTILGLLSIIMHSAPKGAFAAAPSGGGVWRRRASAHAAGHGGLPPPPQAEQASGEAACCIAHTQLRS
jgi:senataxin